MMTSAALRPRPEQGGFVLVGVIIFTLALTILGLSLFSLSSFEAQFWNSSMEEQQAFYYAVGGIERAKMALANTEDLGLARIAPGGPSVEHVDYAVAIQTKGINEDSTYQVKWDPDSLITIRARAVYKRASRMVEVRYAPSKPGMYRYLISVTSPADTAVRVRRFDATGQQRNTTFTGSVWQTPSTPASDDWRDSLALGSLVNIRTGAVPLPDLNSVWSHYASAVVPGWSGGNSDNLYLDASATPGVPKYFKEAPAAYSNAVNPNNYWGVNRQDPITLRVSGIAVWMLGSGVRTEGRLTVRQEPSGPGPHALIIVAHPNSGDPDEPPDAGIAFLHSATFHANLSPPVPTFLVSDGSVVLEHRFGPTIPSISYYLSIYAKNVVLMGPIDGPGPTDDPTMLLSHPPSILEDQAGQLLDVLYDLGALPNTTAGQRASFKQDPGSWREIN